MRYARAPQSQHAHRSPPTFTPRGRPSWKPSGTRVSTTTWRFRGRVRPLRSPRPRQPPREPRTSTTCRCSSRSTRSRGFSSRHDRVGLPQHPVRRASLRLRRGGVRAYRAPRPRKRRNLQNGHSSVHLHGIRRHEGIRPGSARYRRGHHDREAGHRRHAREGPIRQRCSTWCSGAAPTTRWASDGPATGCSRSYEMSAACSKQPDGCAAPRRDRHRRRHDRRTSPSAPTSPVIAPVVEVPG